MEVSIIMPVYNTEKYLSKAIESVLSQTLPNFEFFLVDDGSTDRSGIICDEYAIKDTRLKIVHQKNQGAPIARNTALKLATGKYVYFMDSDDWIEPDMLEKMYLLAEKEHADLIVEGFCMEYYQNGHFVTYQTKCPDKRYEKIEDFRIDAYHYLNNSLLSLPWNKLFCMDNIRRNNLSFRNTKWDDHHFCMDYLMDCKRVVLSSAADYHWYRSRKESQTAITYSDIHLFEKRKEHYEHIILLYKSWNINDTASMEAINSYYAGRLAQCVQEVVDNKNISRADRVAKVNEIINDPLTENAMKEARNMSVKMKIMVAPIRWKNVPLCFLTGKGISWVRKLMPGLFIKMKEHEVHGA